MLVLLILLGEPVLFVCLLSAVIHQQLFICVMRVKVAQNIENTKPHCVFNGHRLSCLTIKKSFLTTYSHFMQIKKLNFSVCCTWHLSVVTKKTAQRHV